MDESLCPTLQIKQIFVHLGYLKSSGLGCSLYLEHLKSTEEQRCVLEGSGRRGGTAWVPRDCSLDDLGARDLMGLQEKVWGPLSSSLQWACI